MSIRQNIRIAVIGAALFILLLIALKFGLHLPKQLFLLLSGSFIAASILFWSFRLRKRSDWSHVLTLTLAWSAFTFSGLGLAHKLDHSRWIWYRLTGYDEVVPEHLEGRIRPAAEFVQQYPMFKLEESARLVLPAGEHVFAETVVIPQGVSLWIEPGATLRFAAGRSLISFSEVHAEGTEQAPILFTAKNSFFKWGTVGIVRANKSTFRHVRFQNARRARLNDTNFVAGLSMVETDVEINNSQFVDMFGKDAINVVKANAIIRNSLFKNSFKDGIDIDSGTGEISHNAFVNCEDESIDLSDNFDIEVFGNEIFDRRGGRIAADNNIQEVREGNTFGYLDGPES